MFDIEKGLQEIGTFGVWHIWTYFWIFYLVFVGAMINSCIVFMEDIPDFICDRPELSNFSHWTFEQIRNISTPKQDEGDKFDGCKYFARNYSDYANMSFNEAYNSLTLMNATTIAARGTCSKGPYIWHLTGMRLSIVNQWTLVCDNAFQVSNALTVYMVGFLFGCLIASFLSDRFGRKLVIVVAGSLTAVFGIVDAYIPNIYGFFVGRFFVGFFLNVISPTLYVLALEICVDKVRKPIGALYFVAYSMGYAALAGVALAALDWRIMHVAVSAPMLISPLLYWLLPESPRWLVSRGREMEARQILEKAARWNKKKISPEVDPRIPAFDLSGKETSNAELIKDDQPESANFFVVFTHWKLALRTCNIFFNWMANTFVYYGISFLITSFGGSIFVNNAISGALETPAYLLCWPLLMWARKKSLLICLFVAGVSCLLYLAVPDGVSWAQLLVAFAGKLAITASFNIIYLVTAELYPNSIRGASVALGSMVGRVGSIVAPWVVLIAQKNESLIWVAMAIFGITSLIAGVLTFFIPESQNQPLPETLEEAINYPPKRKEKEPETKYSST